MKKTIKRHWDHVEVYQRNPEMLVVLGCGHKVRVPAERNDDGAVEMPPEDVEFDCLECGSNWQAAAWNPKRKGQKQ